MSRGDLLEAACRTVAAAFALTLACGLVALATAPAGTAQTARTVRIVVPYPPASGPDILSRLMAEQIGRMHGATVLIENRPGGGTVIGTEAVARAAPDGGTVLLVANSFVVNPALKPQSYDAPLVVRFQHSHLFSASEFANVGIKGPLARIEC
jgi:tripartite-type tricarboxylate transporter receptor subunit TctC